MNVKVQHSDRFDSVEVDLKDPKFAAFLAWLWPGAGHLYQRRIGKGVLFMGCILTTYFFGLAMGGGHVVYASFGTLGGQKHQLMRYPFLCQIGVGMPAVPALAQRFAANRGYRILGSSFMAPPGDTFEQRHDELAHWHEELGFYFELGSLYTMVAGLLNILVIFDAYAGPAFTDPKGKMPPKETNAPTKKK